MTAVPDTFGMIRFGAETDPLAVRLVKVTVAGNPVVMMPFEPMNRG